MKIYLAGIESLTEQEAQYVKRTKVNGLASFYNMNTKTEELIPYLDNFLLDSGAFTLFSAGKIVDWDAYITRYANFIKRNNIQRFFELDIDVLVGYEKVLYLRNKLEDLVGRPAIPVWHKFRGRENFLEMCDNYQYVAIGGIVSGEIKRSEYPVFSYLISEAHKRQARIHGLGFTNLTKLPIYHFDSVDSTGWLAGNRFGHITNFNGYTLVNEKVPTGRRLAESGRRVKFHNLQQWIKYAQYADTKF